MRCPKCQAEVLDDSRFCSKCGTPIHPSNEVLITQTRTILRSMEELRSGTEFAGKYTILEALKDKTAPKYFLRIKKGSSVLCMIQGEQPQYGSRGWDKTKDPNIPEKCTLKMGKDTEEQIIYFTVETGKKNRMEPYQKLRFKMEYEE